MGAGIGAIFRAPLGGAVMAAEILYLHDLEVEALIPALIASIVGYTVFGAYRRLARRSSAPNRISPSSSPIQLRLLRGCSASSAARSACSTRASFYGIDRRSFTACACRAGSSRRSAACWSA